MTAPSGAWTRPRIVVSEFIAVVLITLIAIFVFEVAWRLTLAVLILAPAAYAAIITGWFAATIGHASSLVVVSSALTVGVLVRAIWVKAITFWRRPEFF